MGMFDAIASMFDTIVNLPIQLENQTYNRNQQTANKNWQFADSRAGNDMMSYFIKNGSLDGYTSSVWNQDYNDVADYLNPFLSLSSLDLSQRAQKFAEEQFKYSQYVTENSAKIKMDDLKNAGLSPLLATGNSASYSPVSMASGSVTSSPKTRPGYTPTSMPLFQMGNIMKEMATIDNIKATTENLKAQKENIQADTDLKEATTASEKLKPDVMKTGIAKDKADIKQIEERTEFIKQQINTEFYKGYLTQSQIKYFAQQTANLEWDLKIAQAKGITTKDTTSAMVKAVKDIVHSTGVSLDSTEGKMLLGIGTAFGAGVLAYTAGRKMVGKGVKGAVGGIKNWWKNRKNKDKDLDTILMR